MIDRLKITDGWMIDRLKIADGWMIDRLNGYIENVV